MEPEKAKITIQSIWEYFGILIEKVKNKIPKTEIKKRYIFAGFFRIRILITLINKFRRSKNYFSLPFYSYTNLYPDVKAIIIEPIMIALIRIPVNLMPFFCSFFIFFHPL
jgi:hypothetical protein